MSNRFRVNEGGFEWDMIALMDLRHAERRTTSMKVTGLVSGDNGALLLLLPGMVDGVYAMKPGEARCLRDALIGRVTDDPDAGSEGA